LLYSKEAILKNWLTYVLRYPAPVTVGCNCGTYNVLYYFLSA